MENTQDSLYPAHPSGLARNMDAVQHFVRHTFQETKKEIGEGLNYFKDGIADRFQRTGSYLNNLVLPVNNFIKDVQQMEQEFEQERTKNSEYCICLNGQMVPASEVLKMDMEENY
jgi:hypothetical protein